MISVYGSIAVNQITEKKLPEEAQGEGEEIQITNHPHGTTNRYHEDRLTRERVYSPQRTG